MRRYLVFPSLFITIMIGVIGCDTDFELNSEWKEIAVVYGLLDQSEDLQYIRVNKAFLTEDNALDAAQVTDSLYFSNAVVRLNEWTKAAVWSDSENKFLKGSGATLNKSIELPRINVTSEADLPDKEEGVFANDPYYLYVLDNTQFPGDTLSQDFTYEIEVETDQGNIVSGITPLVRDFLVLYPKPETELNFLTARDLRWKEAGNGTIYDLDIKFRYREEINNDPDDFTIKEVVYRPFSNFSGDFIGNNTFEFKFEPELFLQYLKSEIGEEGAEGFKRIYLPPMEFTFYAGSKQLQLFSDVANIGNNSINSDQARPFYTNVENGLGLIASRYKKTVMCNISPVSLDELICGEITQGLRFVENSNAAVNCN